MMEMNKKDIYRLTYIVPIYNMEKYMKQCIDSIIAQESDNIEIILIDDGSTDDSPQLCDEYSKKFQFIHTIHKENGGISSARNAGLNIAKGKYICFVDSDDFYKIKFADEFLNICESNNVDIIRGWYGIYDEEIQDYLSHPFPRITYAQQVLSGYDFLVKSISEKANEVVPWLGFFRRDYLIKNKLYFPEGISYEEDQLFFLKALLCDGKCRVYQSDVEFYGYRKRRGSATKSPSLKQVDDIIYVVNAETKLIDKYKVTGKTKKAAYKYICSSFYQLTSIYGRLKKKDREVIVKKVPFWIKQQCILYPYDRHQQVKILLFTFARKIVDWIYDRRDVL